MMGYPKILLNPIAVFRTEQVWMAEGDDLALYNANKSTIQSLLEHSGIPESDHKLWIGIYRIGTNQEQARPAVVVSCLDPEVRKQAKSFIKSCHIFRKGGAFAHFTVLSKATPPELPCEPQLTMAGDAQVYGFGGSFPSPPCQPGQHTDQSPQGDGEENAKDEVVLHLSGSLTGDRYLCRPIQARRRSHGGLPSQSATAGPLLLLDGVSYQLTVEHLVNFDDHKSEPTWEHTNDDWDDDDDDDHDDDNAGGYRNADDMTPSHFGTIRTMSEGSLSSEDADINFSGSSSRSSAQELEYNTPWSPIVPVSTPPPQNSSKPGTVHHIAVRDSSSSSHIDHVNPPTVCHANATMDYLLFPIQVNSDPKLCTTGGAEMVQLCDAFDIYRQTRARPVIIATASLSYVRGIVFPASTLLQKPGSRSFQTLFCIESDVAMPKGTSGSAVFDAETGLPAGYLVLGCPGKRNCYMVSMLDVLAELSILSGTIVHCQVQLNVSAVVGIVPENSALMKLSFPPDRCNRSNVFSSIVQPDLIDHVIVGLNPEEASSSYAKSPSFWGYRKLVTASLLWTNWYQHDAWNERFGHKTKLLGPENRTFLNTIREVAPDSSEIRLFFSSLPTTALHERQISLIERFCEGASSTLDGSVPSDAGTPPFEDVHEPRAWVSDRNCTPGRLASPQRVYGGVLGCIELYEVLQRKVFYQKNGLSQENTHRGENRALITSFCQYFRDDACDDPVAYQRRIYINNPNGASVLALIRTAAPWQWEGFRELFSGYFAETPASNIGLKESQWWGGCFIIFFSLRFFTIATQDQEDRRTILKQERQTRRRLNLSFLSINREGSGGSGNDDPDSLPPPFLHETVCSFMATGKSENYWTAAFLDGSPNAEWSRLPEDDGIELDGTDPIMKAEEYATSSPRAYALASLETSIREIAAHHEQIHEMLEESLHCLTPKTQQDPPSQISPDDIQRWLKKFRDVLERVRRSNSSLAHKLDHFLSQDVGIGQDEIPHSPLWRGLQTDRHAIRSLHSIMESRAMLEDIQDRFLVLLERSSHRERKNRGTNEEKLSSLLRTIAFLQIVLTLLGLAVQLFDVSLGRDEVLIWGAGPILVMLIIKLGAVPLKLLRRRILQTAHGSNFLRALIDGFIVLYDTLNLFLGIWDIFRSVRNQFRRLRRRNGDASRNREGSAIC